MVDCVVFVVYEKVGRVVGGVEGFFIVFDGLFEFFGCDEDFVELGVDYGFIVVEIGDVVDFFLVVKYMLK